MRVFVFVFLSIPFLIGFWGIFSLSFGNLDVLALPNFTAEYWLKLAQWKSLFQSIYFSLCSGFISWGLSLFFSCLITSSIFEKYEGFKRQSLVSTLLSIPHISFAIGFAFLLAPSGWFFRLAHFLFGVWPRPPGFNLLFDINGISYISCLILKEVPFLVFIQLGVLRFLSVKTNIKICKSLGYSIGCVYWKILLPQIYSRIKPASMAVLAYSLTGVEIPLIIGFRQPQVFQLEILDMLSHPSDLSMRFLAAAASILLILTVFLSMFAVRIFSPLFRKIYFLFILNSRRQMPLFLRKEAGLALIYGGLIVYSLTLITLGLWSFAGRWRYPDLLPDRWSPNTWSGIFGFQGEIIFNSILLGFLSSLISLVICVAFLEEIYGRKREIKTFESNLIYLPLIVPQISLIFGILAVFSQWRLAGTFTAVVWGHVLFVFPYIFFTLGNTYRTYDARYLKISRSLGCGFFRYFFKVKIPILMPYLLISFSIGFAVSFAQYLPTLLFGGGRISTVTLEAVSSASGSNRKTSGAFAFAQTVFPMLVYLFSVLLPPTMSQIKFKKS